MNLSPTEIKIIEFELLLLQMWETAYTITDPERFKTVFANLEKLEEIKKSFYLLNEKYTFSIVAASRLYRSNIKLLIENQYLNLKLEQTTKI